MHSSSWLISPMVVSPEKAYTITWSVSRILELYSSGSIKEKMALLLADLDQMTVLTT